MTSSPSESQEASLAEPRLALDLADFLETSAPKGVAARRRRSLRSGVTANQVTLTSLVGSVPMGAFLCRFAAHSGMFAMLPAWLVARTAFAAIDGTLAIRAASALWPASRKRVDRRAGALRGLVITIWNRLRFAMAEQSSLAE
jgi:hypothetical protein